MTVEIQQILVNWEEHRSIINWKNGLKYNSHKNKLSPKTLQAIRNWMPLFIEYAQKNPDDIIEEAKEGKHVVKARLSDFCTWAEDVKGKKFNASVHGSYHIIRGFYSHNEINTQKIRTPKTESSEVQFSDGLVPLFDIVEIEKPDGTKAKDKRIKREFLKSFLECLSPRDKIICMCIKDSGLDPSDVLDLPLKIVRYHDSSSERIFISSRRNKTGEIISTFFTKETSKLVRHYVQLHRKNAQDDEPIFVQSNHEAKIEFNKIHKRKFDSSIDTLNPKSVKAHYLAKCFRLATEKLEKLLSTGDKPYRILQRGKQSPLRPKRFRKVFNNVCDSAGIPLGLKMVFMGKSDSARKEYADKDRQDLEMYYEKIELRLTIYAEPINESSLIEIKNLQDISSKQQTEINELKEKLNSDKQKNISENLLMSKILDNAEKLSPLDYQKIMKLLLKTKK